MAWKIVPQVIKVKGVEVEVLIKRLLYYPEADKRFGTTKGFGRLKPKNSPWQVLIAADGWGEKFWKVKISPSGNFSIVYNEGEEALPPGHPKYPGVRRYVNQETMLSFNAIAKRLMERIKDEEFVRTVLVMLATAEMESRQEAA